QGVGCDGGLQLRWDWSLQEPVGQNQSDPQNPGDSQLDRPITNPVPFQVWQTHDMRDVAKPDQAVPYMLGSMHGENQHQVLERRSLDKAASNGHGYGSPKNVLRTKINGIEAWQEAPLNFQ